LFFLGLNNLSHDETGPARPDHYSLTIKYYWQFYWISSIWTTVVGSCTTKVNIISKCHVLTTFATIRFRNE